MICRVFYNRYMKILLSKIMCQNNLSIRQVSILTGVPRSTVADIISGRTSPRMDTMEQLAVGLKIHIEDLYDSPFK
ncbi:helix-turn-helix transcriptional regulator [Lachnospiraceae bacterium 50-23]